MRTRIERVIAAAIAAGLASACVPGRTPPATTATAAPQPVPAEQSEAPAATPPVWEARPVTPRARAVDEGVHIVRPGETLIAIGARTGAGAEAIARANALINPDQIRAGQRLRIPGGRYHEVARGEAGIAIARAYGVRWSEIVRLNALAEPFTLRVGQGLQLPNAGQTLEQRAAAFRIDIDDILTGGEPAQETASLAVAGTPAPSPATVAARAFDGRFAWPVSGSVIARFGPLGGGRINDGINIAVTPGTPVLAAADGVVAYAGNGINVFGGLVLIRHEGGWSSAYGHASELLVKRGDRVRQGQTIALSGQSGFVDRPQLHFQIRRSRTPVNPLDRLPVTG